MNLRIVARRLNYTIRYELLSEEVSMYELEIVHEIMLQGSQTLKLSNLNAGAILILALN